MIAASRGGWLRRLRSRASASWWPLPPRVALAGSITVLLCGAALLYHVDPSSGRLPRCVFHSLTSLHCPGCGSTRAIHALLHGDVATAMRFNPLTLPALALLGVAYFRWVWRIFTGSTDRGGHFGARVRPAWLLALAIFLCLFWIARNVPIYPLTLLAPPTGS